MQNLVAILKQTLGSNFNMLYPFKVDPSEAKAQPNIVVFVEPRTITNWFELRLQVMSRLRATKYATRHVTLTWVITSPPSSLPPS